MDELLVQWTGYVVEALLALSRRAWRAATGHTALGDLGAIRLAMREKMVLGLEFFLAGLELSRSAS